MKDKWLESQWKEGNKKKKAEKANGKLNKSEDFSAEKFLLIFVVVFGIANLLVVVLWRLGGGMF